MPSSTFATVSHASTRGLERLEDVLPADHDHRVDAVGEQRRDRRRGRSGRPRSRAGGSPRGGGRRRRPSRSAAQRARDLLGAQPTSTSAICCGLLHRRLDAVEAELVGGLLGVVDDVVERAGQRVARRPASSGARPVPLPLSRWMMSWAMRSPSCSQSSTSRGQVGALGVVGEQVAQQQRRALDVAPGLLEQVEQARDRASARRAAHARPTLARAPRRRGAVHSLFTAGSPADNRTPAARARERRRDMEARGRRRPARAGELEVRPADGLRAGRRAARWRCRSASSSSSPRSRGARGASSRARSSTRRSGARPLRDGRPLGRRLRPQAAREARGRAAGLARSSTRTSASATGSQPEPSHAFHKHGHRP